MPTINDKKTISQFNIDIESQKNKIKALDEQIKALKDEKRERKRNKYTSKSGEYIDPKKYTVDRDGHFHHRF